MSGKGVSNTAVPRSGSRKRLRFEAADASPTSPGFGVGRGFSRTTAERYLHIYNYVFHGTKPPRDVKSGDVKDYRYILQIKKETVLFSESTCGGSDLYENPSSSRWTSTEKEQLTRIVGGAEITDPHLCNGGKHKRVTETMITESRFVGKMRLLITENELEAIVGGMIEAGQHGGFRQIQEKLRNNYSGVDSKLVS